MSPIDAVTDPDPVRCYDALARRPLTWDDSLRSWVASRADDVRAVLGHSAARVRPLDSAVPLALARSSAGEVFGRLVRMHDRDERAVVKDAIANALGSLGDERVARAVEAGAASVARAGGHSGAFVDRWVAAVPLGAVAALIGIAPVDLSAAVEAGRSLAACFGPVPPADAAARADRAVGVLSGLASDASTQSPGLAAAIRQALPDHLAEEALANTIGLLFQTADATAGLCANTLVRLVGRGGPSADELAAVVADVSRDDPAVHNTRRWFAASAIVGGVAISAGDAVLVVLAAANRDPTAAEPMTFGAGGHRCPATVLAPRIAALTVEALVREWPGVLGEIARSGYRPLANIRIATFV